MAMPVAQQKIDEFNSLREEYGDEELFKSVLEIYPNKKPALIKMRNEYGVSGFLDSFMELKSSLSVTPSSATMPRTQLTPTQPEPEPTGIKGVVSGIGKGIEKVGKGIVKGIEIIDRPGTEASQAIRSKYLEIMGVLPKADELWNAVFTKDRAKLVDWYSKGLILTGDQIESQLGKDAGEQLINEMWRLSKQLLDDRASRRARGVQGTDVATTTGGIVGESFKNVPELLLGPEDILKPTQFALNVLTLGLGGFLLKRAAIGATKGMGIPPKMPAIREQLKSYAWGDIPDYFKGIGYNPNLPYLRYLDKHLSNQAKDIFNNILKEGFDVTKMKIPEGSSGNILKQKLIAAGVNKFKNRPAKQKWWIAQVNSIPVKDYDTVIGGYKLSSFQRQDMAKADLREAQAQQAKARQEAGIPTPEQPSGKPTPAEQLIPTPTPEPTTMAEGLPTKVRVKGGKAEFNVVGIEPDGTVILQKEKTTTKQRYSKEDFDSVFDVIARQEAKVEPEKPPVVEVLKGSVSLKDYPDIVGTIKRYNKDTDEYMIDFPATKERDAFTGVYKSDMITPATIKTAEGFSIGDQVSPKKFPTQIGNVVEITNKGIVVEFANPTRRKTYTKTQIAKAPTEEVVPEVKPEITPEVQPEKKFIETPIEEAEPYIPSKKTIEDEINQFEPENIADAEMAIDNYIESLGGQLPQDIQAKVAQYIADKKAHKLIYDIKANEILEEYPNIPDQLFANMLAKRINVWDIVEEPKAPQITKQPVGAEVPQPEVMPQKETFDVSDIESRIETNIEKLAPERREYAKSNLHNEYTSTRTGFMPLQKRLDEIDANASNMTLSEWKDKIFFQTPNTMLHFGHSTEKPLTRQEANILNRARQRAINNQSEKFMREIDQYPIVKAGDFPTQKQAEWLSGEFDEGRNRKPAQALWHKERVADHKLLVEQALSEGKLVPESVLADYPDLKPEAKLPEKIEDNLEVRLRGALTTAPDVLKKNFGTGTYDVENQRLISDSGKVAFERKDNKYKFVQIKPREKPAPMPEPEVKAVAEEPVMPVTKEVEERLDLGLTKVPEEQRNVSPEEGRVPVVSVSADEIGVRSDIMQFKQMEDKVSGINKEEVLEGTWDDYKAGNILLWEPSDPAKYDLPAGQKYLVVNGHHRLQFGKERGVKSFNSQVLREADGYSVDDARRMGAEVNITEGRGSIYDQVKFLRELSRAYGKNEAMGRASTLGVKGRQATTIAYNAEASLYSSFINEVVTPEQAEVIAKSAPNNDLEQQFGIRYAQRGLQGDTLKHMINASRIEREQMRGTGKQFDLFGQDDTVIQMMEQKAKIATEYQKAIRQQILSVQGAAKRPDLARKMGVDVSDPLGVTKKIDQLKGELVQWENWALHPELVKKVNDKFVEWEKTNFKQTSLDLSVKQEVIQEAKKKPPTAKEKIVQAFTHEPIRFDAEGKTLKVPQPSQVYQQDGITLKPANEVISAINSGRRKTDPVGLGSYVYDPNNPEQGFGIVTKTNPTDPDMVEVTFNGYTRNYDDKSALYNILPPKKWGQEGFIINPFASSKTKLEKAIAEQKDSPEWQAHMKSHITEQDAFVKGAVGKSIGVLGKLLAIPHAMGKILRFELNSTMGDYTRAMWKIAKDKTISAEEREIAEISGQITNNAAVMTRYKLYPSGHEGHILARQEMDNIFKKLPVPQKKQAMDIVYHLQNVEMLAQSTPMHVADDTTYEQNVKKVLDALGYNENDPVLMSRANADKLDFITNQMRGFLDRTETQGRGNMPATPQAYQAVKDYYKLMNQVKNDLIIRGKLDPDKAWQYYAPRVLAEMLEQTYRVVQASVRGAKYVTRPYLKQRHGSTRTMNTNVDLLYRHYGRVLADNMYDDGLDAIYRNANIFKRVDDQGRLIDGIYDLKQLQRFTSNEDWVRLHDKLHEGDKFIIGGQEYRVSTPQKTYNPETYLVPKGVYDGLIGLSQRTTLTTASKIWSNIMTGIGLWKQSILGWFNVGLPYYSLNIIGNNWLSYLEDIGRFKHLGDAVGLMDYMKGKGGKVTARGQEAIDLMKKQDILSGSSILELGDPEMTRVLPTTRWWWRAVKQADQINKITATLRLLDQYKKWQAKNPGAIYDVMRPQDVFTVGSYEGIVKGLTPENVIGYIAREAGHDYMNVSDWFVRYVRGAGMPFATFPFKSAQEITRYFRHQPIKAIAKTMLPAAGLYAINMARYPEVEDKVGNMGSRPKLVIHQWEAPTGMGDTNRYGLVLAPPTPFDTTANLLGVQRIWGNYLKYKNYKDAGSKGYPLERFVSDSIQAIPKVAGKQLFLLANPIAGIAVSLLRNKDVRTGETIVKNPYKNMSEWDKYVYYVQPYIASSLMGPLANLVDLGLMAKDPSYQAKTTNFGLQTGAEDLFFQWFKEKTGKEFPAQPTVKRIKRPIDAFAAVGLYVVNLDDAEQRLINEVEYELLKNQDALEYQINKDFMRYIDKEMDKQKTLELMKGWLMNSLNVSEIGDTITMPIIDNFLATESATETAKHYGENIGFDPDTTKFFIKDKILTPSAFIAILQELQARSEGEKKQAFIGINKEYQKIETLKADGVPLGLKKEYYENLMPLVNKFEREHQRSGKK